MPAILIGISHTPKLMYFYNCSQLDLVLHHRCQLGFPLSLDFSNFQVPGLLNFFSPGTMEPLDFQGPVLSVPGSSCPGTSGTSGKGTNNVTGGQEIT